MLGDIWRACMKDLDTGTAMRCWSEIAPDMPQPEDERAALATLHYARTTSESMPIAIRCYSHAWLLDHDLPSGLPDNLKPAQERLYPRKVEAVGVAVKAVSDGNRSLAKAIERAMSDAVADCYANGDRAPQIVRARMEDARLKVLR